MSIKSIFLLPIYSLLFFVYLGSLFASEQALSGYKLVPEDILNISVWKEDGLQKDVIVRPDGLLTFPLVGTIRAQGRTVEEVNDEITNKIKKYIPEPVVTVSLIKVSGNKIYVLGKVNRSGAYVVGRYIDVMQALALAGGLTAYASENNIVVLRRVNGKQIAIPFAYGEVKGGSSLEQNIILRAGDSIIVQ